MCTIFLPGSATEEQLHGVTSIKRTEPVVAWKIFHVDPCRILCDPIVLHPMFIHGCNLRVPNPLDFARTGFDQHGPNIDDEVYFELVVYCPRYSIEYREGRTVMQRSGFFSYVHESDANCICLEKNRCHSRPQYHVKKVLLLDVFAKYETTTEGPVYLSKIFYIF